MSKKIHIGQITEQVIVKHNIECGICSNSEYSHAETVKEATQDFYDLGWRYGVVKYYAAQGVLCPACWFKRNKGRLAWED